LPTNRVLFEEPSFTRGVGLANAAGLLPNCGVWQVREDEG